VAPLRQQRPVAEAMPGWLQAGPSPTNPGVLSEQQLAQQRLRLHQRAQQRWQRLPKWGAQADSMRLHPESHPTRPLAPQAPLVCDLGALRVQQAAPTRQVKRLQMRSGQRLSAGLPPQCLRPLPTPLMGQLAARLPLQRRQPPCARRSAAPALDGARLSLCDTCD